MDADSFIPMSDNAFTFGLGGRSYWIRVALSPLYNAGHISENDANVLAFDYAPLQFIDVYFPIVPFGGAQGYVHRSGGWGYGAFRSDRAFVFPSFDVPDAIDTESHVYVRVASELSTNFRLFLAPLVEFRQTELRIVLFLGAVSGSLLAMGLYNLVLFLVLRDRMYLRYLLYVFVMLVYQAQLVGISRFLPFESALLNPGSVVAWTFAVLMAALAFSWSFLDVPHTARGVRPLYYTLWCVGAFGVLLVALGYLRPANMLVHGAGLMLPLVAFTAAGVSYRNGSRVSRYFLAASTVLLVSVFVFALRGYGVIPHSYWLTHAFFAAAGLEAVLYSFAMADRVRVLHSERSGLVQRAQELSDAALTDELTGLRNRRFFNRVIPSAVEVSRAARQPLSLLYLDLDRFKLLNDTYGHACGDTVLRGLGIAVQRNLRSSDVACRLGGDEFALILPGTDASSGERIAERIRLDFLGLWSNPGGGCVDPGFDDGSAGMVGFMAAQSVSSQLSCSMSVGLTELRDEDSPRSLIARGDKAMYSAKAAGGDRVIRA